MPSFLSSPSPALCFPVYVLASHWTFWMRVNLWSLTAQGKPEGQMWQIKLKFRWQPPLQTATSMEEVSCANTFEIQRSRIEIIKASHRLPLARLWFWLSSEFRLSWWQFLLSSPSFPALISLVHAESFDASSLGIAHSRNHRYQSLKINGKNPQNKTVKLEWRRAFQSTTSKWYLQINVSISL